MAKFISGLDLERYTSEVDYRAAIQSNIKEGWAFIAIPTGYYLSDYTRVGNKILIHLVGPTGLITSEIQNEPGIHKV